MAAPTFVAVGAAVAGSTSLAVAYPTGIQRGDLLILGISNKYPSNGPSTPSGWTAPTGNQQSGGAGASGADAGNVYATVFYKVADGTETVTLTVTITSGDSSLGVMAAYRPAINSFSTWTVECGSGADSTAGTGWSVTTGSITVATDDLVYVLSAINSDAQTYSAEAITLTGATFGTATERADAGTTTGDDTRIVTSEHFVTAGSGTAAATYTMTASGSTANAPAGATVVTRFREVAASQSVWVSQQEVSVATQPPGSVRLYQQEINVAYLTPTPATVTPTTVAATATVASPSLFFTAAPATVNATATVDAANIGPASGAGTVQAVTTVGTANVQPVGGIATVAAAATVGSVAFTSAVTVIPATVAAATTVGQPSLFGTVQVVATIGTAVLSTSNNATVTPPTVAATATVGAAVSTAGSTVAPATVAAAITVTSGGAFTPSSPSTVFTAATVGTALVTSAATSTPTTVPVVAAVGAPTIPLLPSTVPATVTVGSPTVTSPAITTPTTVQATATVGSVRIPIIVSTVQTAVTIPPPNFPALIRPTVIAAAATVGAVTVTNGPDNDYWQNATALTGASGTASANMINATADGDYTYTQTLGDTEDTVWFTFTPSGLKNFAASVTAVSVSVVLELIPQSGTDPTAAVAAAAGTTASIAFDVTDGAVYYLRVSPTVAGNEAVISVAWAITDRDTTGGGSGTGDLDLVWLQNNADPADEIAYTPGTLLLTIANGAPDGTVTFTIDGNPAGSAILDSNGSTTVSILVPNLAAGTYTLTVTSGAEVGSLDFTVLNTAGTPAVDGTDDTPTPPVQTGVQKWVLQDPLGTLTTYLFPYNPSNSGNQYKSLPIDGAPTTSPTGVWLEWEGSERPNEWTFEGYGDTEDFYNTLVTWSLINRRVWLVDHRGWQYVITVEDFDPTLKRNLNAPWAFTYRLTVLVWAGPEVAL